jgi:CsoR family transcriptional regulator, copper-sensing transcriptional repressor
MAAYEMHKADIAKRLARIEGQVRGVARMVDEGRYCIDILDQVSAITKALQQVSLRLMHDHLGHCVADAVHHGGAEAQEKIDEATSAIARLMRA